MRFFWRSSQYFQGRYPFSNIFCRYCWQHHAIIRHVAKQVGESQRTTADSSDNSQARVRSIRSCPLFTLAHSASQCKTRTASPTCTATILRLRSGQALGSTSVTSGAQTSKQTYYAYGGVRSGTLPTDYSFTRQTPIEQNGRLCYIWAVTIHHPFKRRGFR